MSNPDRIYLQPAEQACETEDRQWCDIDDPSGHDGPWVEYVLADRIEALEAERDHLREQLAAITLAAENVCNCLSSQVTVYLEELETVLLQLDYGHWKLAGAGDE